MIDQPPPSRSQVATSGSSSAGEQLRAVSPVGGAAEDAPPSISAQSSAGQPSRTAAGSAVSGGAAAAAALSVGAVQRLQRAAALESGRLRGDLRVVSAQLAELRDRAGADARAHALAMERAQVETTMERRCREAVEQRLADALGEIAEMWAEVEAYAAAGLRAVTEREAATAVEIEALTRTVQLLRSAADVVPPPVQQSTVSSTATLLRQGAQRSASSANPVTALGALTPLLAVPLLAAADTDRVSSDVDGPDSIEHWLREDGWL